MIIRAVGLCSATKNYIDCTYDYQVVVNKDLINEAISRLLLYTKSNSNLNILQVPIICNISNDEITLTDNYGNTEVVTLDTQTSHTQDYTMKVNIADIKYILDTCRSGHFTTKFGNHSSFVVSYGPVSHLVRELGN